MTTLTAAHRLSYERDGFFKLPAGVSPRETSAMADALWSALEKRGIRRDAPESWPRQNPSGFASLGRTGVFAPMASPTVTSALDDLLGADWVRPNRWGIPLVTFPNRAVAWDVPHAHWHLDSPATESTPDVARVFVILWRLGPRGGGTALVAGSHSLYQRLARRAGTPLRSADAIRRLRAEQPWFAALSSADDTVSRIQRFMHDGAEIDSVPVRVVEMTGEPGDVWFMHPSLLHTLAPNVSDRPRLVLTQWINGACQAAAAPAGMGPM
jgi:hypothetical protein